MTVTITTTSPTITISTTTATTSYSGSEIRTLGGMLGRGRLAITSTYTVVDADRGKTVDATSGTFSLNLTSAATLGSGWHFTAANSGSGTVTIDPASTETIRGPAGSATTLALTQGQAVTLVSDGTNWLVVSSVGLAPVSSTTIITSTIQAATSAGVTVQNSTPATVMTIGPGPGTGVAFAGGITCAAITATSASGITTLQASTQDAIALLGRAGGTSSYVGTITPTTLTASRTYTMPDATIVVSGSASALTSGRVPYVTTGGLLTNITGFTFNGADLTIPGTLNINQTGNAIIEAQASTTNAKYIRLGNDGASFFCGVESNVAGGFFTGSNAYDSCFWTGGRLFLRGATGVAISGAITTSSNITQSGATTFSTGTGAVSLNGVTTVSEELNVALGTITSSEFVFDGSVTWNSGGTTFDGIKLNVTDTASASASTLINLQVAASSKFSISKSGNITAAGDTVNLNGRALFYSDASNGILYGGSTGFIVASTSGSQSWLTTTASATTVQSFTANTNSAATAFRIDHETSGTPANGLGTGFVVRCETSTTANQNMFQVESTWVDVTHASRKARTIFYEYDTTSRECLRMEASGTAAMLGFYGASAIARPSSTGETVGFTAGAGTNVTDASTFTGNVGATAYRLSDIVKHLKNLGLIAS